MTSIASRVEKSQFQQELVDVFKLAIPVALGHLANMAMQLVDTMFVGKLGAQAIGGVATGNAVYATFMIVGIGIMLGVDFTISHAFGAKKYDECNHYLVQAIVLSSALALLFTTIMYFGADAIAWFGADYAVVENAKAYLQTICFSLWPFLLFTAFRQYLQAMGSALFVLGVLVVGNILNALFNYLLVYGNYGFPALGVRGSACATFVARTFALTAVVLYVFYRDRQKKLGLAQTKWRIDGAKIKQLLKLGLPASAHLLLEVGVFASSTLLAGRLGAQNLAAHQIVLHIASMTFMVPLGIGAAAAVLVGQNLGAQQPERAVRLGYTTIALATLFMASAAGVLYLFSTALLQVFTHDLQVIEIGNKLILIAALFQISDGIQVVASGALRGLGDTKSSMIGNLLGHWFVGLPIGATLCFVFDWKVQGLWVGLSIGLTAVALFLALQWVRKSQKIFSLSLK